MHAEGQQSRTARRRTFELEQLGESGLERILAVRSVECCQTVGLEVRPQEKLPRLHGRAAGCVPCSTSLSLTKATAATTTVILLHTH